MTIPSVSHTQSSDSSKMWINRNDALRVLAAADSGRIYMNIAIQYKIYSDTLISFINRQKRQIDTLTSLDAKNVKVISSLQSQIDILSQQKTVTQSELNSLNKEITRQKRKRKWTAFGGLAGMGLLTYLLITK